MKMTQLLLLVFGIVGSGMIARPVAEASAPIAAFIDGTPADELGQAIGFYSNGSLRNATHLPPESSMHSVLFRPRNRSWGTADLVELLKRVSEALHYEFPSGERLQIGDLSNRNGGLASGHASHQNGLDVDLAYLRVNRREQVPHTTTGFDEEFVVNGKLTSNFDLERNWRLVEILMATGRVERMFVDAVIKKAFCTRAEQKGDRSPETMEALRRLRPWPHHGNHIHVRISCPAFSPRCESQAPPPEGSGCQELT